MTFRIERFTRDRHPDAFMLRRVWNGDQEDVSLHETFSGASNELKFIRARAHMRTLRDLARCLEDYRCHRTAAGEFGYASTECWIAPPALDEAFQRNYGVTFREAVAIGWTA